MSFTKAAFFDRDGTIIKNVPYLSSIDKIEFIRPAIELCKLLYDSGYKIIIVTNQSGIARGLLDETRLCEIHSFIETKFLERQIKIEKFYFCPHHPTQAKLSKYKIDCDCRKPNPGMILRAGKEFSIDFSKSLLFGDSSSDISAGEKAGVKSFYIQNFLENEKPNIEMFMDANLKVRKDSCE